MGGELWRGMFVGLRVRGRKGGGSHHPQPVPPSDTDLFVAFILKTPAL